MWSRESRIAPLFCSRRTGNKQTQFDARRGSRAAVIDWYCILAMNDPHATQITPNYPVITLITVPHSVVVPELK